mmetsp:Transcript_1581/g.4323  ORF Transcript_1581/g.4323 Transcript_1581/m.4323 type:complete len:203 (+) Transcript_1581:328-936(+)
MTTTMMIASTTTRMRTSMRMIPTPIDQSATMRNRAKDQLHHPGDHHNHQESDIKVNATMTSMTNRPTPETAINMKKKTMTTMTVRIKTTAMTILKTTTTVEYRTKTDPTTNDWNGKSSSATPARRKSYYLPWPCPNPPPFYILWVVLALVPSHTFGMHGCCKNWSNTAMPPLLPPAFPSRLDPCGAVVAVVENLRHSRPPLP